MGEYIGGVGARSPFYRRALLRLFSSVYFRRRGRTGNGSFEVYVSPGSSLGVLDFRKSLVDLVHERFIREWITLDAVVWDIGANMGLFAFPAGLKAIAGRVYAFEPDLELAHYLLRSVRLRQNKKLNISVICIAVSNADGVAKFQISKFSRAMNKLESVGEWHQDKVVPKETRLVPTIRIDTLVKTLQPPTILKVDVEGAEVNVLEGGEETISSYRPTVLIEGPNELGDPMQAFFEKHRYVLFDGETADRSPLSYPVWNTIAVPKEKLTA
jgi:FkbM family methyltransferase